MNPILESLHSYLEKAVPNDDLIKEFNARSTEYRKLLKINHAQMKILCETNYELQVSLPNNGISITLFVRDLGIQCFVEDGIPCEGHNYVIDVHTKDRTSMDIYGVPPYAISLLKDDIHEELLNVLK